MELGFSEKDKNNLIQFLNLIAKHAELKVDVDSLIQFYKLLAWCQQELIPKIESNTLEITKVSKPKEEK